MTIQSITGGAQAYSAASGGKIYQFNNVGSDPDVEGQYQEVAPANPSRRQIVFHNPGTVDIFVYPNTFQTSGSSVDSNESPPITANPGGAFLVFANGGTLTVTGECTDQWNAFSRTGTDNALTVMDSNI